jgi:AcrR family transcriptional regulator
VSRIQDAAIHLFASKGYYGTSIADIARGAGLTKGALYCHFESKGALLLALIKKWEVEYLDALIDKVNQTPGDVGDQFYRWHTAVANFSAENRELCVLQTVLSAELSGSNNEFDRELRRLNAKYARFVQRLIEKGKAQGLFDQELDSHTLAHVIIAFTDGVLLQWHKSRDYLEGSDYARVSRQVIMNGLKCDQEQRSADLQGPADRQTAVGLVDET